jgi:hypothetical protein
MTDGQILIKMYKEIEEYCIKNSTVINSFYRERPGLANNCDVSKLLNSLQYNIEYLKERIDDITNGR